jgi:hypothetical protein
MEFLIPNYSCLQNPWLRGYRPQILVLSVLNWICWTPPKKFLGTPLPTASFYVTKLESRLQTESQMLSNHLNQDALDGNFAPSLPSSTNTAGKKKHGEMRKLHFPCCGLGCASWLQAWACIPQTAVRLVCQLVPSTETLYGLIQFQPLRFHCRDAVFTVRYDLNL